MTYITSPKDVELSTAHIYENNQLLNDQVKSLQEIIYTFEQ